MSLSIQGIRSPACFLDAMATVPAESNLDLFPSGVQVHNAWHISWASSDRAALSPTPPALPCTERVHKWVPGETLAPKSCTDSDDDGVNINPKVFFVLVAGLPAFFFVSLISCCMICIYSRRKSRRARSITAES
jgi:hypothetical protein